MTTLLDPVHEHAAPVVMAVGRLVLGGAALEKVLLVDIIMRDVHDAGTVREELRRELSELERRGAGKALERLRDLPGEPWFGSTAVTVGRR